MPNLGSIAKYIGIFSMGKGFLDKVILEKLLRGAIGIVSAAVVVAILAGALILTVLGAIYYALVSFLPIQEWAAVLIVAALTIAIIIFIVYKITEGLKKIAMVSSLLAHTATPTSPITDIIGAFIDGIKASPEKGNTKQQYPRSIKRKS